MIFDRYGIHWLDGGIALLVQLNVQHVLGVSMDLDVTVKLPRSSLNCPHNLNLQEVVGVPVGLIDDPLVAAMLPLPKELGTYAIHVEDTTENRKLIQVLLRLSSSDTSSMRPLWMGSEKWNADALSVTNVAPLVLFGFDNHHIWQARKVLDASQYLPRKLILMGPVDSAISSGMQRIKPTITAEDVFHLPLEQIGAGILKQYMLGNQNENRMDTVG